MVLSLDSINACYNLFMLCILRTEKEWLQPVQRHEQFSKVDERQVDYLVGGLRLIGKLIVKKSKTHC